MSDPTYHGYVGSGCPLGELSDWDPDGFYPFLPPASEEHDDHARRLADPADGS